MEGKGRGAPVRRLLTRDEGDLDQADSSGKRRSRRSCGSRGWRASDQGTPGGGLSGQGPSP